MKFTELFQAFAEGHIEKRTYWTLVRERCLPLLQFQQLLAEEPDCTSIEIRPEGVILTYRGIRMLFDFDQTFCRAEVILSIDRNPEQEDFDFIGRHLPQDAVVMDVGANVGIFSLSLWKDHPNIGKIYAFEPLPTTFAQMQRNLALNAHAGKIAPVNAGVSNEKGSFDFFLPGADEAASMQPNPDAFYQQESVDGRYTGRAKMERHTCAVTTLDAFVQEHDVTRVDLVKCDVEGNERNVLLGGANVLKKYRPVVYCEMLRKHAKRFGYHPNDIIADMRGRGYRCYTFRNHELTHFDRMDDETVETNFFFLPEEKAEQLR